ncbi:GATA-type zinc finger transcription factor [Phycomyces blakesleeanus]
MNSGIPSRQLTNTSQGSPTSSSNRPLNPSEVNLDNQFSISTHAYTDTPGSEPQMKNKFIHEYFGNDTDYMNDLDDEDGQMPVQRIGSDFRKRRNWSERIVGDVAGLLHILSPVGKILYCSESWIDLTGHYPHELVGRPLTDFMHIDDLDVFIRDFNLAFHRRIQVKTHFRLRKKDDTYILLESIGQLKYLSPDNSSQSFFAAAHPYSTKSNVLVDSFLELKMENDWLRQRLREMSIYENKPPPPPPPPPPHTLSMPRIMAPQPPTFDPSVANSLPSYMLQEVPENITDDAIFQEPRPSSPSKRTSDPDELSKVPIEISDEGPMEFRSPPPERKEKWKRRKKQRNEDDYVCTDCGTTASPEWRKGPQGSKTLCNACGLRWAKKNKKHLKMD